MVVYHFVIRDCNLSLILSCPTEQIYFDMHAQPYNHNAKYMLQLLENMKLIACLKKSSFPFTNDYDVKQLASVLHVFTSYIANKNCVA